MPPLMLDAGDVSRRIKAGRELRNMSQEALAALMVADGIQKHDLGQIERTERTMQRVHKDAILRHLRLPARWLEAETVDEIVGLDGDETSIRKEVAELRANVAQLVGVMTSDPEAGASLQDKVVKLVEQAMTQRAREVGRRTLPPGKRPAAEGQRRAS